MAELVLIPEGASAAGEVEGDVTIGREGCDLTLADAQASRRHAALRQTPSGPVIEDLGSRNGTFVNDQRITAPQALREGDVLRIGETRWRLERRGAPATAFAPRPAEEPPAAEPPPVAPPPAEEQRVAEPPPRVAEPPPPAPESPPRVAEPAPAAGQSRGDVPAPDFAPSAIRRQIAASPGPAEPSRFDAPVPPRGRGSAARRVEATLVSYVVVLLTAIAVVAYLAAR